MGEAERDQPQRGLPREDLGPGVRWGRAQGCRVDGGVERCCAGDGTVPPKKRHRERDGGKRARGRARRAAGSRSGGAGGR